MTEKELQKQMDKDMEEIFKTKEIVDFTFDLVQKAYLKGIETGMKIRSSEKLEARLEYAKEIIKRLLCVVRNHLRIADVNFNALINDAEKILKEE